MAAPAKNAIDPYAKYLADVDQKKVASVRAMILSADGASEPNNSGITTDEFLAALKAVADRYPKV